MSVGDLSEEAWPKSSRTSTGADKLVTFVGGGNLAVSSLSNGSNRSSGEKRCVLRLLPITKSLTGTSAWSTCCDITWGM